MEPIMELTTVVTPSTSVTFVPGSEPVPRPCARVFVKSQRAADIATFFDDTVQEVNLVDLVIIESLRSSLESEFTPTHPLCICIWTSLNSIRREVCRDLLKKKEKKNPLFVCMLMLMSRRNGDELVQQCYGRVWGNRGCLSVAKQPQGSQTFGGQQLLLCVVPWGLLCCHCGSSGATHEVLGVHENLESLGGSTCKG